MPDSQTEFSTDFLRLFSESSRSVYWLIRSAAVEQDAADEIFQETSVTLWKKFAEFEPGTNFTAWAQQIARFEVRRYQSRRQRDRRVFSEEFTDYVLEQSVQVADSLDRRRELLADCFAQLTFPDRHLINERYKPGATSKMVARLVGRSEGFVSKSLARIHRVLFECISQHEQEAEP